MSLAKIVKRAAENRSALSFTRYERGFITKCAEYGVDAKTAQALMQKQAQSIGQALSKGFTSAARAFAGFPHKVIPALKGTALGRYGARYLELLGGGNKGIVGGYNAKMKELQKALSTLSPKAKNFASRQKTLQRQITALKGAGIPGGRKAMGFGGQALTDELAKANLTRAVTGVGAVGGGALGIAGLRNAMDSGKVEDYNYRPSAM